jgi:hypothetical protein
MYVHDQRANNISKIESEYITQQKEEIQKIINKCIVIYKNQKDSKKKEDVVNDEDLINKSLNEVKLKKNEYLIYFISKLIKKICSYINNKNNNKSYIIKRKIIYIFNWIELNCTSSQISEIINNIYSQNQKSNISLIAILIKYNYENIIKQILLKHTQACKNK